MVSSMWDKDQRPCIIQPPLTWSYRWGRGYEKDEVEEKDQLSSGAGDPSGKSSCVHEKNSFLSVKKVVFEGENKTLRNSIK